MIHDQPELGIERRCDLAVSRRAPSTALREGSMTITRARFGAFQLTGRPPSESAVTLQWPSA